MQQIFIDTLMSRNLAVAKPDTPLNSIVDQMAQQRISCIIIVEEDKPVGIITERDLVRFLNGLLGGQQQQFAHARDFMTTSLVLVPESTPLFDALVLVEGQKIRHLPVVNNQGSLVGILTYTDLVHAYEHIIEQQREIIEKEAGAENKQLREVNEQLQALSMEDPLLEVGNRRAMEVDLGFTHSAAVRYHREYAIVLFDIDCFKLYNDHYGHQAGDQALKLVAEHIRCSIRKADRLYRYGGEELLLLLPETDFLGAKILADRVVDELAERNIPHAKSQFNVLTMSGGIAAPNVAENIPEDWQKIIEQADQGLYMAKEYGRNQVCCIHESSSSAVQ